GPRDVQHVCRHDLSRLEPPDTRLQLLQPFKPRHIMAVFDVETAHGHVAMPLALLCWRRHADSFVSFSLIALCARCRVSYTVMRHRALVPARVPAGRSSYSSRMRILKPSRKPRRRPSACRKNSACMCLMGPSSTTTRSSATSPSGMGGGAG